MTQQPTVLVIDDEPAHRLMVRVVLGDAGFRVLEADNGSSGLVTLRSKPVDVVLLDMRMPGMSGLDVLQKMHEEAMTTPVIMLTAFGNVGSAVEAMKIGAWDYLTKPTDNDELLAVVQKAAEHVRLTRENRDLKKQIGQLRETRIIGSSGEIRRVVELIEQVGPSEANVLILGESGTGKELVAQQLHEKSARSGGPLVKVNCAALPENLLESELFGYVRGAFTGAAQDKPGRFQLAGGGTLFLDEIGELPLTLQAKILRALQERIVEPLGGVTPVSIDVRFIAATNRDLPTMIAEGKFREDLYYRLNVLEIRIPPLRERIEDIPLLVDYLLDKLGRKNSRPVRTVSREFLDALNRHEWRGNVRELENVLERALILCRADTLDLRDLPEHLATQGTALLPRHIAQPGESPLETAERQALEETLRKYAGHRERTAQALGISRRTLQYRLKKYGLTTR
ncbi:MAG: sigma-54 dependent transcriptional regulator [Desulfomicrobium sp.]|nr:sigma-54 dependent transcriptional regulator [Pseudomonadota bacterium]MBV1712345.1 sigma-54 dependent transcriptional regulator [Desulfomicrobium sp.]MBU4572505.1 sigma-54 dependent transcriptional regulator [Pseudomonadota bacterium]MBU4595161.1 sigma-54 dependent transcriptional regulator [Pseudomonadota bacterium]MBV1719640.1 sigma-54 dependent transcriptional regulator [Desulfomicrobium sp.]